MEVLKTRTVVDEVNRAKRLARRLSSLHFRSQSPSKVQTQPGLPTNAAARTHNQVANAKNSVTVREQWQDATKQQKVSLVEAVAAKPLREWDHGIFSLSLIRNQIYPQDLSMTTEKSSDKAHISEGTYAGTKRALTQAYITIENR
jgi:hypothetical protein